MTFTLIHIDSLIAQSLSNRNPILLLFRRTDLRFRVFAPLALTGLRAFQSLGEALAVLLLAVALLAGAALQLLLFGLSFPYYEGPWLSL